MKKLIISSIFTLLSTGVYSQYGIPTSVTEDKELSKYVFNHINTYRGTIQEKPYIWTDFWYNSAKRWNNEISTTGKWGHNRGQAWENFRGQEMIVAVPILSDAEDNYQYIAETAITKWLQSKYHVSGIIAPRQETVGDTGTVQFGDAQVSGVLLCKYGAISVNILKYPNYKIAYIVFQLGYYVDKSTL
jgi:hypothetical protein